MGILMLGLKWGGLLFGAALLLRILIPIKLSCRTCRWCAYDMTGIPGMKCPECGPSVKQEKKLWRQRIRKSRIALMLLLLTVSYAGSIGERTAVYGWPAAVPSTVLIATYPMIQSIEEQYFTSMSNSRIYSWRNLPVKHPRVGPVSSDLNRSLHIRANGEFAPLWRWQRAWLRSKAAQSVRNDSRKGEQMLFELGGWAAMSGQQRNRLLQSKVDEFVVVRQRTPIGSPVLARVQQPSPLGEFRVTLSPVFAGERESVFEFSDQSRFSGSLVELGHSDIEVGPISIDVRVVEISSGHTWSSTIKTDATIGGELNRVLPAIHSEAIDRWLLDWADPILSFSFLERHTNDPRLEIELALISNLIIAPGNPRPQPSPIPEESIEMVLHAEMELLAGGDVIATGRTMSVMQRDDYSDIWMPVDHRSAPLLIKEKQFWAAFENGAQISVRIRPGYAQQSLKAFDAKSRWEGDLIIPVKSIIAADYTTSRRNPNVHPTFLKDKPLSAINLPNIEPTLDHPNQ